jgi:hypothetical protein
MAKRSDSPGDTSASDDAPDDKDAGKFGYKIMVGAGAAVSGIVARKVLDKGWKTATGKEPPTNPEHLDVKWSEAATWAVASAGVVALVRLAAQRRVAATWRRASGHLPPGMESSEK